METNNRNYGLDILRIISMLGIVGLHVLGQGGILANVKINTLNYTTAYFMEILLYASVNIFAMLTGYLYCDKAKIKSKSVIELIFTTVIYCLVITGVFYIFNLYNVRNSGIKNLIVGLFPPIKGMYWYITSYVLVFFMIPYMNKLLNAIDKETLKKLLVILFVFFCIISIFGIKDYFKISYGYSPFWLIYCYFIGAYIKRYISSKDIKPSKLIAIVIINILVILLWNIVVSNLTLKLLDVVKGRDLLMQYHSPLIVVNAICIFLLLERVVIKNIKTAKLITKISTMTFGVYIIHCHVLIYENVLKNAFQNLTEMNTLGLFVMAVFSILGIFCIAACIEFVREKSFKLMHIDKLIEAVGSKLDRCL